MELLYRRLWRLKTKSERMTSRRLLISAAVALPLSACAANISIQSNKDTNYSGKVSRVLLVMELQEQATYLYPYEVRDSIVEKWQPLGIAVDAVRSHTPDPKQSLKEAIASFRPTHVIELQATQSTTRGGNLWVFTVDCSVLDVAQGRRIWRAAIRFDENISGKRGLRDSSKKTADKLADELAAKLRTDGLL